MQTDVAFQCSRSVSGRPAGRYFLGLYSPAAHGGVRLGAELPFTDFFTLPELCQEVPRKSGQGKFS